MIGFLLLLAAQSAPAAAPDNEPQADDIVVTAVRDKCVVRYADKTMTDADLDARAAEWKSGTPVRVTARDVDFACARKIANRLFAKGVMKVVFVDPTGKPARPFEPNKELPKYDAAGQPAAGSGTYSAYMETRAKEHSFIARAAAQMIREGKCDEARDMTLREGDLDAAAAVAEICRK